MNTNEYAFKICKLKDESYGAFSNGHLRFFRIAPTREEAVIAGKDALEGLIAFKLARLSQ